MNTEKETEMKWWQLNRQLSTRGIICTGPYFIDMKFWATRWEKKRWKRERCAVIIGLGGGGNDKVITYLHTVYKAENQTSHAIIDKVHCIGGNFASFQIKSIYKFDRARTKVRVIGSQLIVRLNKDRNVIQIEKWKRGKPLQSGLMMMKREIENHDQAGQAIVVSSHSKTRKSCLGERDRERRQDKRLF